MFPLALVAACVGGAQVAPGDGPEATPPLDTEPTAPADPPEPDPTDPALAEPLPICINELVPDNEHGWTDETGADADWIELHNPGPDAVALDGWRLNDHPLDGLVVPRRGYLVLAADGQPELGATHLGLSLSGSGEELALWAPDGRGAVVTYGPTSADRALARETDCCAEGCWIPTMRPTPGASNAGSLLPTVLVARDATWRYAEQEAAGWMTRLFDDSGWATGAAPLGYGEPVATEVSADTVWFRETFEVVSPGDLTAVRMRLRYDDSAVVYLNGTRIFGSNAPETPGGFASGARDGVVEARWHEAEVWRPALLAGENVLAVEVAQASADSDDLRFELELRAAP